MGAYQQYNGLSDAERSFVRRHPFAASAFRSDATTALGEAQRRYPRETLHNGIGDAFRHCFWNALMTRDEGAALAEEFGNAHETNGGPAIEGQMDLYNNGIGRTIGAAYPNASDAELAGYCAAAVSNDQLLIIDEPTQTLVRSQSRLPYRP